MIWVGTSGFQYPEWKGKFYPRVIVSEQMLPFYGSHFPTTEVNYTFYRIPAPVVMRRWCLATSQMFRFGLKAPRQITHARRLLHCKGAVKRFVTVALRLKRKLGPILFQLPPFFKKDVARLEKFLKILPARLRFAFEFRHASWFVDEVYELLRSENAALCIAESEKLTTPVVMTADFGYFRLREERYTARDIKKWAQIVAREGAALKETFVYFKHERKALGPKFARLFLKNLANASGT